MDYIPTHINEEIEINEIVTVHYFEYAKNFIFGGESHDFWELVYVDKGEVVVTADDATYILKKGDMIFHKPNEFHSVVANGVIAPNLVVISFICKSPAMSFFENKIIKINEIGKDLLAEIYNESKNSFSSPLDDVYLIKLRRRTKQVFGSEQLIKINLEYMLIMFVRQGKDIKNSTKLTTVAKQRSDRDMVKKTIKYLQDNIYTSITFADVCKYCNQSRTNLKVLFKSVTGMGIMEYYRNLKIDEVKTIIREKDLNFTEISEKLGYKSVHYFSRHFKQATGMTPTEYAASVKAQVNRQ